MKKGTVIGLFLLICVAATGAGFIYWRSYSAKQFEARRFQEIRSTLAAGDTSKAYDLLQARPFAFGAVSEADWTDVEIDVLEKFEPPQISRLTALWWRAPEAFASHEKATLLVARALLDAKDLENLKKLRASWFGKESQKIEWYKIDVDALITAGKKTEAIKVLVGTELPGKEDAERLMRLAILDTDETGQKRIGYLRAALQADPKFARAHSMLGLMHEGRKEFGLAHAHYSSALEAAPEQAYYRDQLGEFYRRYGKLDQAFEIWSAGMKTGVPADFLVLKSIFWNRMVRGAELTAPRTHGDMGHLVRFVSILPKGYMWNDAMFAKIPESRRFEQTRPEVFWMRVFGALMQGEDDKALSLLTYNPFQKMSWNPELERALMRILVYRTTGDLKYPLAANLQGTIATRAARHPFLQELDRATGLRKDQLNPELRTLLDSPHAAAAAFLVSGWREAGLTVAANQPIPNTAPAWYVYELGRATFVNKGAEKALQFAEQAKRPEMALLKGEVLLAKGAANEALAILQKAHSAQNPALKSKSTLLLAVALASAGEESRAAQILAENAEASATAAGRALIERFNSKASVKVSAAGAAGGLAR